MINFMSLAEPHELKYLNFAEAKVEKENSSGALITLRFILSRRVYIQSRVVYDLFMMLGEVGGLSDFFVLILSTLMTVISGQSLSADLITKLFRFKRTGSSGK